MANGNCLYNACSIAITGNNNDVSVILHCLTSIELFENASYYANHPVINSQHESGAHSLHLKMPLQCACLILPFQFMKTLIAMQLLLKKPRTMLKIMNSHP